MKIYGVCILNKTDAQIDHEMLFADEGAALNHAEYLITGLLSNGYCLDECYEGETPYFSAGETFKVFIKDKDTAKEKTVEVFIKYHVVF